MAVQGMPLQAAMGPPLKPSRSTPVIPEEGPAPSIADFPRSSLDAARMMPTLLEQLQASTGFLRQATLSELSGGDLCRCWCPRSRC